MKHTIFPLYLILCLLLSACGGRKQSSSPESEGDTLTLKYAKNLCIVKYNDYTLATLRNPWDTTKVLRTYILTDKSKPQPSSLPQGTLVQVPLSRSLVYSSVHCSLLDELEAVNQIKGVCDLSYISIPSIQEGCRSGKITNAGNSMSPDIEKIIDMHPDAILLSPYENSNGYGRIEKLNIPIIECADYMETSPLGRAEWMRFFGLLYGCEHKTDSLFAQVEKEYSDIKSKTSSLSERPSVFSELKIGSTWYVAGGNSTTSRFFADAGARYVFSQLPQSGSVALSAEAVLDKAQNADFWLIKYNQDKDKTYTELKKEDVLYAQFEAFKNRQIYGCNTHYIRFYEESPFHPEYLLKDFVKIFHPELLPDYQSRYFHSLNE